MKHRTFSKLIVFQASITFLDGKASSARIDPLVAFLETDTAVAFCDRSEFWNVDAEFEGTAVAVALVCLELWIGVWFRHWRMVWGALWS
jgi:hypothetical protein